MKIETRCPKCQTRYLIPAGALPEKGGKVACRKCNARWLVAPRADADLAGPGPGIPPPGMREGASSACPVISCPHCSFYFLESAAEPLSPDDTRPRVLVVDDHDFFRSLVREALGERFAFLVAPDPQQALRILTAQKVDLVVLDLNLNGIEDGLDVLRGWKANGTPVLILTGNDQPELYGDKWEELRRLGATDLLIKGLNIRELLAMKIGQMLHPEPPVFHQPTL